MIKLKTLLFENVSFTNNNEMMIISSPKGNIKVNIFMYYYNRKKYCNGHINFPPEFYKNGIGYNGRSISTGPSQNVEQAQINLKNDLKRLGLPYVHVSKLKVVDKTTPEVKLKSQEFLQKLQSVVNDFNKEMQKPENQPKDFGKGPMEFGQWVTKDDVKGGRLQWVIDNYGDFWLVIKWSMSPRQTIKASEFVKNYDTIMRGREGKGDYAREVFVRDKPFENV